MKKLLTPLLFALIFLFLTQSIEARSGCCSHHGGVCGCGCCDGTSLSATCRPYYADVCSDNNKSNSIQNVVIEPTSIPIPKPTKKPLPTSTPKPTSIPKPTSTPEPTATPSLSTTIEPTSTPTFEPTPKDTPQVMGEKVEIKITFWQKILRFFGLIK